MYKIFLITAISVSQMIAGQIYRVDPPNWWVGMQHDTVQLMMYGKDFSGLKIVTNSSYLEITDTYIPKKTQYAFVDIHIAPDTPGGEQSIQIETENYPGETITYEIRQRNSDVSHSKGFDCSDIIYLITPDRFANGNPDNDQNAEMVPEHRGQNEHILKRSGGDIKGIISKLDYIKDLGFTAIWINPLTENNMPISYHGYAVTDLYRIDPRFGSNKTYFRLVNEAHQKGLSVIMDHVSNHIGINHPWMKSLPEISWINGTVEEHSLNRHHKIALLDPYGDKQEIENVTYAWFDDVMPDLNQKNAQLAKYLIQNTIWWIESSGIDGIREDTYPYNDLNFMSKWAEAVLNEYPAFNIVGEVWIQDPVFLAPFQADNGLPATQNTNLPSVTDFGLFEAFGRVFLRDADIKEFYTFLAKDRLYPDPNKLVTFIDNHDVMRLYDLVGGHEQRYVMALKMLLTLRGIPQIYYGTEIGLHGGPDHGEIRRNFPGGFPGDSLNAFTAAGRTDQQNIIFDQVKSIINLRKEHPALACGDMVHIVPENNVYVYLRILKDEIMLMIANNNDEKVNYSVEKISRYLQNNKKLLNVETSLISVISPKLLLSVPANDVLILKAIN
jgi:glycosidase